MVTFRPTGHSAFATGNTCSTPEACPAPSQPDCCTDDCYTKEQALDALMKAENSKKDARENFLFIKSNMKPGETWKQGTEEFLRLLEAESNTNTSAIQMDFRTIGDSIRPGESRNAVTSQFLRMYQLESPASDSAGVRSAFTAVAKSLKNGETREEATEQYARIRKAENRTSDAEENYLLVNQYVSEKEQRPCETSQFIRILERLGNNETTQAQADFKLIH
ncbi:MAG: hypothetical protein HYU64_02890 [Armatimonadetes bacterium]|nr:hypothetical protein [Armatimonadota bacterium]